MRERWNTGLSSLMQVSISQSLEWCGVVAAIMYSLLVALIVGLELMGFTLLLVSSFSIGLWAYLGNHRGILYFKFYATAGIIGLSRWF
jgi:hypothetical protein